MYGKLLQFFFICIESIVIAPSIHGKNFCDLLNICESYKTISSHSLCCLRYLLYCYDLMKVESTNVFINFINQFLIYGLSSLHALQILMQSFLKIKALKILWTEKCPLALILLMCSRS